MEKKPVTSTYEDSSIEMKNVEPGKKTVKTERSEQTNLTPVSIRSGALGISRFAKGEPASKSLFKFSPKFTVSIKSQEQVATDTLSSAGKVEAPQKVDLGGLLAQSLTIKNVSVLEETTEKQRAHVPVKKKESNFLSVEKKLAQHFNTIRKKKKKTGSDSINLSELSWAENPGGVPIYTPITLPYIARSPDGNEAISKRPTIKLIDEANRNASCLFETLESFGESEMNHEWFLLQFPDILPALQVCDPSKAADAESIGPTTANSKYPGAKAKYTPSRLEELPEGRLGTVVIYKSGRVVLICGNHEFEINQGTDCNFAQEVACLVNDNTEVMFLGKCKKRLVLTPNISHYTSKVECEFEQSR